VATNFQVVPVDNLDSVTKVFTWVLCTFAGVIAFLFRTIWNKTTKDAERLERKLDQCEEKHEGASKEISDVKSELAEARGRLDQQSLDRREMMDLHKEVLEEVRNRRSE
jgi:F0F1-type ATP synthase membrane subunit b/b'